MIISRSVDAVISGDTGLVAPKRKAIEVATCRRETVERIITVAMSAPLDVTEFR